MFYQSLGEILEIKGKKTQKNNKYFFRMEANVDNLSFYKRTV